MRCPRDREPPERRSRQPTWRPSGPATSTAQVGSANHAAPSCTTVAGAHPHSRSNGSASSASAWAVAPFSATSRPPGATSGRHQRARRGNGATALNYVECVSLLREGGGVRGVEAVDRVTGDVVELRAPVVVNCAGPSSRVVAERLDRDHERLFQPSLAFNLLLDRPPLSGAALALTPRNPTGRTYFLRSWRGRIVAGTYQAIRELKDGALVRAAKVADTKNKQVTKT